VAPPEPSPPDAPEPLWHKAREAILIGLLALTLNLAGNGRMSLWDRDEPRYAGCTREMRARGDWIRPTFNGEPRHNKPVLIYWLMRAGTALGGDNPFGARLVSATAGAATCLMVWALGRRMLGRRTGLLAALMLATAPIVVAESKLATTDATLMALVVACQFALWELARAPSRWAAGVFWVALALATLTKGPVAAALIGVAGLAAWWWGAPSGGWARLRWGWGPAIFALVTAPWFLAIGLLSRGDFYRFAVGDQVVRRVLKGVEEHGAWPGYYVGGTLLTFYPWSALLPAALLGAWFRRKGTPALAFLLGWAVGPLVLLECVRTKLIHYYLPAYPACALLAAWLVGVVAQAEVNLRRWPLGRVSLAILTGLGIGLTVAALAGALVLPGGLRWPCLAIAVVLGAGTLFAMERFQSAATERAAFGLVATWGVVLLLAGSWLLPAVEPYRLSPLVARRLAELSAAEHATPMLGAYKPAGVVYNMGHPVAVFDDRAALVARARRDGAIVSALIPWELAVFRKDPRMTVEVRGTLRGINVEKGREQELTLVVIRPGVSALAGQPQQAGIK
jgi:4-amino-4-deoxy-L-arabinose transferase-like glycosyltransferase